MTIRRLRNVAVRMRPTLSPPPEEHPVLSGPKDEVLATGQGSDGAHTKTHTHTNGAYQSEEAMECPVKTVAKQQIWNLELDDLSDASHPQRTNTTHSTTLGDCTANDDVPGDTLTALDRDPTRLSAQAKTRIVGFHAHALVPDVLNASSTQETLETGLPAGWLVIVDGPGRGAHFVITDTVASIGRGADQSIILDYGDENISRSNHASVVYDNEQNRFFVGHGNKANVVRRNGRPVLSTEDLEHGDHLRIGKTTLRFVALCGPEFIWQDEEPKGSDEGHDD